VVLAPLAQRAFTAAVVGTADTSVTWSVGEGAAGGTVTATGGYTAPAALGRYHVVVTSVADPTKSAVATVMVTDAPQDLCSGLVQDTLAHPMTAVAKPAVGQAYVDPQFGTTIRRISDAAAAGAGDVIPVYSTIQAWNADESYLFLYHVGGGSHHLYDGKTYAHLKPLNISPADLEQVYWDTVDPKILYYANGRRLYRFNVDTDVATVVHDFATAPSSCTSSLSGGVDPMWTSWDSTHFGFVCGSKVFSYDKASDTVGAVATLTTGGNAPMPAPSGANYYLNVSDTAGQIRDADMTLLRTLAGFQSAEHATLGTSDGVDTLFAVQFDGTPSGTVVAVDMTTGARRAIVGPSTGYPYPPSGTHLSAVAYKAPGWLTSSIIGSASGATLLSQEIILVNANTGGTVCRVANHRSTGTDYWAEPHATISPSGTRILFGSDWGGGAVVDAYVVELPTYAP
jgi:hypothetical protein